MARARILSGALLGALVLAGCGGDGGEDRLTREAFVEQASKVCRDSNTRIEAIDEPEGIDDVAGFVDRATAELDKGLGELRDLRPPEELQADFDRFLELGEQTRGVAGELKKAAAAGDEEALQAAGEKGDRIDAESDRVARRIGLDACAES